MPEAMNPAMPTPVPALETRGLTRLVGGKALVSDISVSIAPGEVMAVVGASGAGKSTFLRLLNRLDEPTAGMVLLNGQDYRAIPPPRLRQRVCMMMQTPFLFPGTVAENIRFGPAQRREILSEDKIAALLGRVGLPGYAGRDTGTLSGGEAQRIALARTLANAPEVLLLDEPTSALDEVSARGVEDLLHGIMRERAMTCVLVTHNAAQTRRFADRVMRLSGGRLEAVGPVAEVLGDA